MRKITNQFTKRTAVYLLANKSLTFDSVRLFITSAGIPCEGRVLHWRVDNGREDAVEVFKQYCIEKNIKEEFTATNTPQQVGVCERVGQALCGLVRCLLVDSGLPLKTWGEFMLR